MQLGGAAHERLSIYGGAGEGQGDGIISGAGLRDAVRVEADAESCTRPMSGHDLD